MHGAKWSRVQWLRAECNRDQHFRIVISNSRLEQASLSALSALKRAQTGFLSALVAPEQARMAILSALAASKQA